MHLIRRHDHAWTRLSHFRADGRVEPDHIDVEPVGDQPAYHVHSFSSKSLAMFCQSAHSARSRSSAPGPSFARAFLNCLVPSGDAVSHVDFKRTSPSLTIELYLVSEVCLFDDGLRKANSP